MVRAATLNNFRSIGCIEKRTLRHIPCHIRNVHERVGFAQAFWGAVQMDHDYRLFAYVHICDPGYRLRITLQLGRIHLLYWAWWCYTGIRKDILLGQCHEIG